MSEDYRPEWWPPREGDVVRMTTRGGMPMGLVAVDEDIHNARWAEAHVGSGVSMDLIYRKGDPRFTVLPWREYADPEFVPGMIVAPETEDVGSPRRWCYWPTADDDSEPFASLTGWSDRHFSGRDQLPERLRVISRPEVAS